MRMTPRQWLGVIAKLCLVKQARHDMALCNRHFAKSESYARRAADKLEASGLYPLPVNAIGVPQVLRGRWRH